MIGFLYILLTIGLLISIVFRKRKPFVDPRFMVEAGLLIYYALPGIRYGFPELFSFTSQYSKYIDYYGFSDGVSYFAFICIVVFYFAFIFGGNVILVFNKRNRDIQYTDLYFSDEKMFTNKMAMYISIACLGLFLLYCTLFGGFRTVMLNIADIRNGLMNTNTGTYDFANKLYKCAPFAVYLLVDRRQKAENPGIFIFAMIVSLLTIISAGGRGILLTFFLTIIIGDYIRKTDVLHVKYNYARVIRITAIIIFALVLYRPLITAFGSFQTGGLSQVSSDFMRMITTSSRYNASSLSGIINSIGQSTEHYLLSLHVSITNVLNGNYMPRLILEPIYAVINILPSKLLGISKPLTLTYYNSLFISGRPNLIQIPSGIVGESFYTGGLFFVFLYGFIFGQIGKKISNTYQRMKKTVTFMPTFYVGILFVYFQFAVGGDFASNFAKDFTSLIVIFYILHNKRVRSL